MYLIQFVIPMLVFDLYFIKFWRFAFRFRANIDDSDIICSQILYFKIPDFQVFKN